MTPELQELGITLVLGMGFAAGLAIGMTISEVISYYNRKAVEFDIELMKVPCANNTGDDEIVICTNMVMPTGDTLDYCEECLGAWDFYPRRMKEVGMERQQREEV